LSSDPLKETGMINHSTKNAAPTILPSTLVLQFDEFVVAVPPVHGGLDAPLTDGLASSHNISPSVDNLGSLADFFATQGSASAGDHFVFLDDLSNAGSSNVNQWDSDEASISANATGEEHAIEVQPLAFSSTVLLTSAPGVSFGLDSDFNQAGVNDHTGNAQPAGTFDQDGLSFTNASYLPSGHAVDAPAVSAAGIADVVSEANGHGGGGPGGGGGGGGGGTVPSPYTTNSGTGVNIHVTYDSSVANAPAGFVSVTQKVADFFASTLQDTTPITINIDVGFGEVDGMKLGIGATGESVTNLQQVSFSDLTNAYSATGLSLGSSAPNGNLYVSYAEAKALNIAITDPQAIDGWVGFSSKSGMFDYNNADGVSSKQYDFYGVVAHEFSEVLGRILLVGGSISNAPSYSAYDFFHFSNPNVQDFSGNGGYFSIDQGTTNLASFNNSSNGGDPGDWASTGTSNSGGSVHDAFNAFDTAGVVAPITHTDLVALQSLGYTLNSHLV
jgi:hypothetical protein